MEDLFSAALLAAASDFEVTPQRFESPGDLAMHISPPWIDRRGRQKGTVQTPALDLIDSELVRIARTPESRLAISIPPQEGKTTRAVRDFIIWTLMNEPDTRIILGTYNQTKANDNGRLIRNMIELHPELGITIARDNGSKSEWSIDGHEGSLISVGRGVGVAGRAADLVIIDDPFKEAEAQSPTIRDAAWEWWVEGIATRFGADTSVVVIHTRWHEDDLIGRLLTKDQHAGWRYINIKAECDDTATDPLGRQPGEFLVSARGRTPAQWESRKATAGARVWAALYQGSPSPAAGNLFKREHIRRYTEPFDPAGWRFVQSWDLNFTGGDKSDFVVGQVWAKKGRLHRLVDQVRGRWDFPETIHQMQELRLKWPNAGTVLVEAKANGSAAIAMLRRKGHTGVIPINPTESKIVRATATTPLWEAGDVELPADHLAPWVGGLIEELVAFPNATNDDQVDSAVQALGYLTPPVEKINRSYGF